MKVLVTGATGLIGTPLCRQLADEGHQVRVLSRRLQGAQVVPGAEVYHWEPEHAPPSGRVWEGVEAVVHLAGEPVVGARWTNEQKRRIRDSRVEGTWNLVASLRGVADRPKVIVSGSAVGYYGNRGGENLDEGSAPGQGFLSDLCQEWEQEALKAQEFGVRVVVVRTGLVLSLAGGALEKMLLPFRLGIGGRLGSGRQWVPWIHIDDIVGILRHAILTPELQGPVNGVAPGAVTNEEFTKELAGVLHRPALFPVPELALRLLLGEMADVVLSSQRLQPKNALKSGYRFQYQQLRPALQDLLLKNR